MAREASERARWAREALEEQARREYAEQGVAPSWRIPEVATVGLAVSRDRIEVCDEPALIEWARGREPGWLITVVKPHALAGMIGSFVGDPVDGCVYDPDQDLGPGGIRVPVPGLRFRPGGQPRSIGVRPEAGARREFSALAAQVADRIESSFDPLPLPADSSGES